MRRASTLIPLLSAAVLCACTGENFEEYTGQDQPPPPAEPGSPAEVPGQAAPGSAEDAPLPANRALGVDSVEGIGTFLTDQAGRPLYVVDRDGQSRPTCFDLCSQNWPPFLAEPATPDALDDAVRRDLIGSVARDERTGTHQTTYAGHPLYYYVEDQEPERTTGHGLQDEWGTWFLMGADGEPLQRPGGG